MEHETTANEVELEAANGELEAADSDELLIEEISIDGMCGVY